MEDTPIEPVIDSTPTGPMPEPDVPTEPEVIPVPVPIEPEVIPEPVPTQPEVVTIPEFIPEFIPEPVIPVPEFIPEPYIPIETYVPPEPESPYITTLEELMSTQGAIVQKEADDKVALLRVFNPERSSLKLLLTNWASQGFPANWVVNTVQANPPLVCADSQTRRFYEYVLYLLGSPIQPFLDELNSRVPGVKFDFFLKDVNTIGLNVSRA